MSTPAHNTDALLIGTGEFSFSPEATSAADALAKGFIDFGNVKAFTPSNDVKKEEHKGSYRGVRRLDKTVVTDSKAIYKLVLDEWTARTIAVLFGAQASTAHTQAAKAAVAADAFAFTAGAPSDSQRWYDITFSGVRYGYLTTVTISGKTEGTDFEVDLRLGRVRFLTQQTATVTPTVTSDAITSSDPEYMLGFTPLAQVRRAGYGRFVCFDQDNANNVLFDHQDFSCEITIDTSSEVGSSFADMTLTVTVTTDVGKLYTREA